MLGIRRHVIVPCMFLDFMHTLWRIRHCFGGNQNAPKTKRWQTVQQTVITFRILTPKQINMTRNFIWKRYSGWLTMGEGRVTEQASTLCQHLACRWGQYCLYLYIVQCCDFVLICIKIELRMQVELDPETVIFATITVIWDYSCICITKHKKKKKKRALVISNSRG